MAVTTEGRKRGVSEAPIVRTSENIQEYIHRFGMGQVATDGVQYSTAATVGTVGAVVAILSETIDPGVDLRLKKIEVGLTQRFTNKLAAYQASLSYYWQARRDGIGTLQWLALTPTIQKNVASGIGSLSEDTVSGFINVASLSQTPIVIRLMAFAHRDNNLSGDVKNSSYVRLIGSVIPGV